MEKDGNRVLRPGLISARWRWFQCAQAFLGGSWSYRIALKGSEWENVSAPATFISLWVSLGSYYYTCLQGDPSATSAPGKPKGIICLLDIYGEFIVQVSILLPSVGSINHEGEFLPYVLTYVLFSPVCRNWAFPRGSERDFIMSVWQVGFRHTVSGRERFQTQVTWCQTLCSS